MSIDPSIEISSISYSVIPYLASDIIDQNCDECGIFVRVKKLDTDVDDINNVIKQKDEDFFVHPERILVATWKNVKSYKESTLVCIILGCI